jgi:hypothetical protein
METVVFVFEATKVRYSGVRRPALRWLTEKQNHPLRTVGRWTGEMKMLEIVEPIFTVQRRALGHQWMTAAA